MLGVDPEIGTSALRLWVTAGSAALLVAFCALMFVLPTTRTADAARAILVAFGAVLGAAITWASIGGGSGDASAQRRALEQRAAELAVRTLAPGSPLACLDALVGDNVEIACEKAVFASPPTVAAAMSYVATRLALLSDIATYNRGGGVAIDALPPLRRALEADRFGFLAHLLAMRDNCTSENCKALALLRDQSQVLANLRGQTFDRYLEHYLPVWANASDGPIADATQMRTTRDGRSESAKSAESGQHRFSDRRLDPSSEYHESRADGAGPAGRGRGGGRQSELAAGSPAVLSPLA